ncbi:MAG: hypothetical protein IT195_00510, partial [Microthrixaceae bacterium]|nr:hypothetical protein [Microthrixaceae bacterium]
MLRDESSASGTSNRVAFSGGTSIREYEGVATTPAVEYVRGSDYGGGIGGVLYTLRDGDPAYTFYNGRGDVVAKTDDSSSLTFQAAYEAFGTRTAEQGSTQDRQKASTKDEDPTGLLNEGFRYRDLETGAFITRDPLGFVDGPNLYAYVVQNPWTKVDPEGLFWSVAFTAGFIIYDSYALATGKIGGAEWSGRMALNGAALLADAATGGMGGGVAVKAAGLAARAGKAGQVALRAAVAVDRADSAYSAVQAGISAKDAVAEGDLVRAGVSAAQAVVGARNARQADEIMDASRASSRTRSEVSPT